MHFTAPLITFKKTGEKQDNFIKRSTLLGVSPMGQIKSGCDDIEAEKTGSNAEVHLSFFKDCFEFYRIRSSDWCLWFFGDNASTNLRIVKLARIPHVGCNSHKLNLEVNAMVDAHSDLRNTIQSVRNTMTSARSELNNSAILRNITDLRPKPDNATRWSGEYAIIYQWTRMRNYFIDASEDPESDISINSSTPFANKTTRYRRMLKEINDVTKSL